jgi:hypothetical protein
MGDVIRASNSGVKVGRWLPYYYKPFQLGRTDDGNYSTDGNTYITQTDGGSDATVGQGVCFDSHNCNFYYLIEFTNTSTDSYKVLKYDLNDNLIDTIYASYDGSSYYDWDTVIAKSWVTIDIGVAVKISSVSTAEDGDIYKVTLPSYDTMERRKIYHGGYSTYLQLPVTEDTSYHSEIIPTNLKDKSISIAFNPMIYDPEGSLASHGALSAASSAEDNAGNGAVSLSLAWNLNKDGAHATAASNGAYSWATNETWSFGSSVFGDSNTVGNTTLSQNDFPTHTNLPASDTTGASNTTGTAQTLNATVSGRAGFAKIRTEHVQGTGTPFIAAANQFWPCILMIN